MRANNPYTFVLTLLFLALPLHLHADIWIPRARPVLTGDYSVGVSSLEIRSLSVAPPNYTTASLYDITEVTAIPPSSSCRLSTYQYVANISGCDSQVIIGGIYVLFSGIGIESPSAPGYFHLCPSDKVKFALQVAGILPEAPDLNGIPVHGKTYSCTKAAFLYADIVAASSQRCVYRMICKNFGLMLKYSDGSQKTIDDVTSEHGLKNLRSHIQAQGIEVRRELSECLTTRCLIIPPAHSRAKRNWVSGGVHCGGLLVWMYCQNAASVADVNRAIEDIHHRIEGQTAAIAGAIKRVTDLSGALQSSAAQLMQEFEKTVNTNVDRINTAFTAIAKGLENQQIVSRLYRDQDALVRGVMDQVLFQRIRAREIMQDYNWYSRLSLSAAEGDENKIIDILAERDLEIASLKSAGYTFVVSSIVTPSSVIIHYSRPVGYQIQLMYLPYRPYIRLEDHCTGDQCEHCIAQSTEFTKLAGKLGSNIESTGTTLQITPFEIAPCARTGAPSHMTIQYEGGCLNVTVLGVDHIPCSQMSELVIKVDTPVFSPPKLKYLDNMVLNIEVLDHLSGATKHVELVKDINYRTQETINKLHHDIEKGSTGSYYKSSVSYSVARDALIVGSVALALTLAQILLKCVKYVNRGRLIGTRIGYLKTAGANHTMVRVSQHNHHTVTYTCEGVRYYAHIHSKNDHVVSFTSGVLRLQVGEEVLPIPSSHVEDVSVEACGCPELDVIFISMYP